MKHISKYLPKKYKVEFVQTETFIVDVYAKDETEARTIAQDYFTGESNQEVGDCTVECEHVYDVTNTDDPFNPENEIELK